MNNIFDDVNKILDGVKNFDDVNNSFSEWTTVHFLENVWSHHIDRKTTSLQGVIFSIAVD